MPSLKKLFVPIPQVSLGRFDPSYLTGILGLL